MPRTRLGESSLASFATFPPVLASLCLTSSKPSLGTLCCPSQLQKLSRLARAFAERRFPGVSTTIPSYAAKMATLARLLIGVAEYKVESPTARTFTSGKNRIQSEKRPAADKFYSGLDSNLLQPSHSHRKPPGMMEHQAHLLPVGDTILAWSLGQFP